MEEKINKKNVSLCVVTVKDKIYTERGDDYI